MQITRWVLLTTVGLAGGILCGLLLGIPLGELVNAMIVTGAVTSTVGLVLGALQSLGLREKRRWWILATTIGVGAGLAAGVVLVEQIGIALTGVRPNIARLGMPARAASFLVVGLLTGATLGFAQSLVLRMRHWTLISAAALAIAFVAGSLLVDTIGLRIASVAGFATFVFFAGAMFGAMTGVAFRATAVRPVK
ncbi:MAG TPA: hypothetical protein VF111_02660 [Thermoanaerobaculia bacterium]